MLSLQKPDEGCPQTSADHPGGGGMKDPQTGQNREPPEYLFFFSPRVPSCSTILTSKIVDT